MFSCEICEIFKNTYFYRTPPVAASESKEIKQIGTGSENLDVCFWEIFGLIAKVLFLERTTGY